jgi:peptidyl-tRNA hydrolase
LASFVVCDFDPSVLRSAANARWLTMPNAGRHEIRPGTVVVVTEGPRAVGYFHVEGVTVDPSVSAGP